MQKSIQAFQASPLLIRSVHPGGFVRGNASFWQKVGCGAQELSARSFLDWIVPEDAAEVSATLAGSQTRCRARHLTRDGGSLPLEIRRDSRDATMILACEIDETSDQIQAREPDDNEDEASVRGTLHTIARIVEEQNPGFRCSILLVADGKFVRGAGPSLPEEYNAAIDGFAIGPAVGSCGTAIYWNVPVIVNDIQHDPLWTPFAKLAAKAGVAACWSHPFTTKTGRVLGALALYAPEPCGPTPEQLGRLKAAARMTGLAVERGRAAEALEIRRIREMELEGQLVQAAKMESVGRLAGGVAHDFNNMLGVILGHAELALEQLDRTHPVFNDLVEIRQAAERSANLTRQLLAFARKQTVTPKPLDLNKTIEGMLQMLKRLIGENIELIWKPGDLSDLLLIDPSQVDQILANLCVNARDSIRDMGKVTIETGAVSFDEAYCNDHTDHLPGSFVMLSVSDTGCGMSAETLDCIFEPFFTTKEPGMGTGLGLATVYGIVRQNNGFIRVCSEPGRGSTFNIHLPRYRATTTSTPENPGARSPEPAQETVLLVEDEPGILSMITMMLKKQGYTVLPASNPSEAILIAKNYGGRIDLLLTDVVMPEMNGRDLAKTLTDSRPNLKRLFMSGYTADVIAPHGVLDRGVHFIQKPFSMKNLAIKLREVLEVAPAGP